MKVFISWSGPASRQVAEALRDWLPNALQFVEPFLSSEDTVAGGRWNRTISNELDTTNFGIVCATPQNPESRWLMFEAGALSKSLENAHVVPYLFGLEPADLTLPLSQFQAVTADREGTRRMFTTMNEAAGSAGLDPARLDPVFDRWWPELGAKLNGMVADPPTDQAAPAPRGDTDILGEVLELLRGQQRLLNDPELLLPVHYLQEVVARPANDLDPQVVMRLIEVTELLLQFGRARLDEKFVDLAQDMLLPVHALISRVPGQAVRMLYDRFDPVSDGVGMTRRDIRVMTPAPDPPPDDLLTRPM